MVAAASAESAPADVERLGRLKNEGRTARPEGLRLLKDHGVATSDRHRIPIGISPTVTVVSAIVAVASIILVATVPAKLKAQVTS